MTTTAEPDRPSLRAQRHGVDRVLPGVGVLRRYRRRWLRADVVAGVTVAAYLVPQVMAYAEVAGLDPVAGLWAAIAPLAVYALVGSSPQLSSGPESTTAIMTATALAPLGATDPVRYAALASCLALIVAAICVLAWLARLGFLADMLSRPVLVGYMTGIALIMIGSQLAKVTGVPVEGEGFFREVVSFLTQLGEAHWPTLLLSGAVLAFLLVSANRYPRWPGPLVAVLLAALATELLSLQTYGVAVVGEIPAGLPSPDLPAVAWSDVVALAPAALGVAIVGYNDNVLDARAFAVRNGYHIDTNQEWLALGASNAGAGLLNGFPVSSSGSRTVLGDTLGSRTQVFSLVTLAGLLTVLLLLRDVLAAFPSAALGAIVIYAAIRFMDIPGFVRLYRFRVSEFALAAATTLAVLAFDPLYGVLVAVALSVLDLLARVARPNGAVLGNVPGLAGMHDVTDYPGASTVAGLVVYRYDSPLFFANADHFRRSALAAITGVPGGSTGHDGAAEATRPDGAAEATRPDGAADVSGASGATADAEPVRWFLLNAEANVEVDATAAAALDELREELARRGIVLALARVKHDLYLQLERAGFVRAVGEERIYATLPVALDAYEQWRRERGLPPV